VREWGRRLRREHRVRPRNLVEPGYVLSSRRLVQPQDNQQCANGVMLVETWLGGYAENRETRGLNLLRLNQAASQQWSIK
jgi:hypothetical protein